MKAEEHWLDKYIGEQAGNASIIASYLSGPEYAEADEVRDAQPHPTSCRCPVCLAAWYPPAATVRVYEREER